MGDVVCGVGFVVWCCVVLGGVLSWYDLWFVVLVGWYDWLFVVFGGLVVGVVVVYFV